jgi:hypothetical protein
MITKTRAWLMYGTCRGPRWKSGFINGDLPRRSRKVKRVFFYHFDKFGDLCIDLVDVGKVKIETYQLELNL